MGRAIVFVVARLGLCHDPADIRKYRFQFRLEAVRVFPGELPDPEVAAFVDAQILYFDPGIF